MRPLRGQMGMDSIQIGASPYPMLFDPVGVLRPGILQLIKFLHHNILD